MANALWGGVASLGGQTAQAFGDAARGYLEEKRDSPVRDAIARAQELVAQYQATGDKTLLADLPGLIAQGIRSPNQDLSGQATALQDRSFAAQSVYQGRESELAARKEEQARWKAENARAEAAFDANVSAQKTSQRWQEEDRARQAKTQPSAAYLEQQRAAELDYLRAQADSLRQRVTAASARSASGGSGSGRGDFRYGQESFKAMMDALPEVIAGFTSIGDNGESVIDQDATAGYIIRAANLAGALDSTDPEKSFSSAEHVQDIVGRIRADNNVTPDGILRYLNKAITDGDVPMAQALVTLYAERVKPAPQQAGGSSGRSVTDLSPESFSGPGGARRALGLTGGPRSMFSPSNFYGTDASTKALSP